MNEMAIRTFLTILETGSISGAAKVLYMTQPAISKRMKLLEEELGYQLFLRDKGIRNIKLTEDGKVFASNAEKILVLFSKIQKRDQPTQNNILHISIPSVMGDNFITSSLDLIQANLPNYQFVLHTRHSYDAYRNIENGSLDVAIVTKLRQHTKVNFLPILHEAYVLVTRKDFIVDKEIIQSIDLKVEHEIRMPWNFSYESWHTYWFRDNQQPFVKLDRLSLVPYFLKTNEQWILLPKSIAQSLCENYNLTTRVLEDGPPELILYMIEKKQNANMGYLQMLAPFFTKDGKDE